MRAWCRASCGARPARPACCRPARRNSGGGGGDFPHTLAVVEEIARALATGVTGFTTHSDIVAPYLLNVGTEDQKLRHLPAMARGDTVASLAITEPGAGSDVKAIRSTAARVAGGYLLNGQKTFITNGFHADRVLVAAKTDPAARAASACSGWTRPRRASRAAGCWTRSASAPRTPPSCSSRTLVPDADLLGEPGQGFGYMMKELARERLMIAARCAMALESALQWTVDYARQRQAFGKALLDNQYIRFKLADIKTLAAATRAFVDGCVRQYLDGELDAAGAAMAKLWAAEATRAIDDLLQFHGGYGYMREYPIGRAYTDVRPNRIYGGASEIMRELIARTL